MNYLQIVISVYKTFGREAAKRFITPPRSVIKQLIDKTGANFELAIEERDEFVEQTLQFVESCLDADFDDPD